ncbi:MAG: hypothetical protein IPH58_18295 [Sphingobacteriales bacterium]|nr:hypothetical protein [Sphingobacteriales bacterium]
MAVGQELTDVKEFGVFADDLTDICLYLKECHVTFVAMESTGNYWQNLYVELIKHGIEVTLAAEASHKMQKYLKILNFRLDVVVNDICGLTGMAIISDICKDNLDPEKLSEHRHGNCRKSKEEIAKALKGNNREDYLSD